MRPFSHSESGVRRKASLLGLLFLAGCTVIGQASPPAPTPAADPGAAAGVPGPQVVQLDADTAVVARLRPEGLQLVLLSRESSGWSAHILSITRSREAQNSLHLVTYGGATGTTFNTFLYGTASPGVARVSVSEMSGIGGAVHGGTYVIALPDKDVAPEQLHWTFFGSDDTVVIQGNGIFPPEA